MSKRKKLLKRHNQHEQYSKHKKEVVSGILYIMGGQPRLVSDTRFGSMRKFTKRKDLVNLLDFAAAVFGVHVTRDYHYDKDGMVVFP